MEARIGKHAGDNLTLIVLIFVMIIPILLRVGTLRIALVTIRTSINVNQSPAIIYCTIMLFFIISIFTVSVSSAIKFIFIILCGKTITHELLATANQFNTCQYVLAIYCMYIPLISYTFSHIEVNNFTFLLLCRFVYYILCLLVMIHYIWSHNMYTYKSPAKCIVDKTTDGQTRRQDGHSNKLTNTYRDKQTGATTDMFRLHNRDVIRQTYSHTDALHILYYPWYLNSHDDRTLWNNIVEFGRDWA